MFYFFFIIDLSFVLKQKHLQLFQNVPIFIAVFLFRFPNGSGYRRYAEFAMQVFDHSQLSCIFMEYPNVNHNYFCYKTDYFFNPIMDAPPKATSQFRNETSSPAKEIAFRFLYSGS